VPEIIQDDESQVNFIEAKDATELALCFILAAAYLGLAKWCWTPLLLAHNWRMLINLEGFFVFVALVALAVGLRPYLSPSNLQLSMRGIKYQGPYWPQRKTVNWEQVDRVYLSPELIVVLYRPNMSSKRIWPMLIFCVYLADREKIGKAFLNFCPLTPVIMSSPALVSRAIIGLIFFFIVVWLFEMLMR